MNPDLVAAIRRRLQGDNPVANSPVGNDPYTDPVSRLQSLQQTPVANPFQPQSEPQSQSAFSNKPAVRRRLQRQQGY